jgi:transcriptional regulator with XRE-family HTH domain
MICHDEQGGSMAEVAVREAFGAWLKSRREAAGLSQTEVDRALGKTSRGFTAQVETGKLPPPPRDVCDGYDAALRLPPGETWAAAAPARLRDFDPELYAWHRHLVDDAAGLLDQPAIRDLLDAVRRFRVEPDPRLAWTPDADETTRAITTLLQSLHDQVGDLEDPSELPVYVAAAAVVALAEREPQEQHRAWAVLLDVLWLARSPQPTRAEARR